MRKQINVVQGLYRELLKIWKKGKSQLSREQRQGIEKEIKVTSADTIWSETVKTTHEVVSLWVDVRLKIVQQRAKWGLLHVCISKVY